MSMGGVGDGDIEKMPHHKVDTKVLGVTGQKEAGLREEVGVSY